MEKKQHHVIQTEIGTRLDKCASAVFGLSRSKIQKLIDDHALTLNGAPTKANHLLKADDVLECVDAQESHGSDLPEAIHLDIVYEDDSVLVINKPAGMVVHPGAGNPTGTLVNALLHHHPNAHLLPRAGLVHRIDKDTTGLLVVAKTEHAQQHLSAQLKDKTVYRHYKCLVLGQKNDLLAHRTIDRPIGRHLTVRTKMAIKAQGKPAITHITHAEQVGDCCLLDIRLETGRTHQIRVHLSSVGYGLIGDRVYPPTGKLPQIAKAFGRQALHAYRLGFRHPTTENACVYHADLPSDMQTLIAQLKAQTTL